MPFQPSDFPSTSRCSPVRWGAVWGAPGSRMERQPSKATCATSACRSHSLVADFAGYLFEPVRSTPASRARKCVPSRKGRTSPQKPCQRVPGVAGLDDVRVQDLRHSFASIAVSGGDSLYLVGKVLGHRNSERDRVLRPFGGQAAARRREPHVRGDRDDDTRRRRKRRPSGVAADISRRRNRLDATFGELLRASVWPPARPVYSPHNGRIRCATAAGSFCG